MRAERIRTIEWFHEAGLISKGYGLFLLRCIARHRQPCACQVYDVLRPPVEKRG